MEFLEGANALAKQEHCIECTETLERSNIGPGLRAPVS
jgi:hypothetical protein